MRMPTSCVSVAAQTLQKSNKRGQNWNEWADAGGRNTFVLARVYVHITPGNRSFRDIQGAYLEFGIRKVDFSCVETDEVLKVEEANTKIVYSKNTFFLNLRQRIHLITEPKGRKGHKMKRCCEAIETVLEEPKARIAMGKVLGVFKSEQSDYSVSKGK